jgi:GntR family transcriptional regulator
MSDLLPELDGSDMRPSKAAEVRDDLRRRITSGEYQPGDRLPRLQELMSTYDMRSRSGLDRAIRELEAEGLLTVVHGGGIYVRERHIVRRDLVAGIRMEHQRAMADIVAGGMFEAMTGTQTEDLTVTTDYQRSGAPDKAAGLLGIVPGAPILVRTFRYSIAGSPHQVARSYLPIETADRAGLTGPERERPGIGTIAQLRSAGIAVGRVHITLETRMPSAQETTDLAIPPGTPVYELWRVMYREGEPSVPAEASTAIVPGDRIAYVLDIDLADKR